MTTQARELKPTYSPHGRLLTIPYTELPPDDPSQPNGKNYEFFRREAGRLLAEGREGKWVVIKDESIVDFYDSYRAGRDDALKKFGDTVFLAQEILYDYPVLFSLWRYMASCPSTPSPSTQPTD